MNQRLKVTKFDGPHLGDHANWAPPKILKSLATRYSS